MVFSTYLLNFLFKFDMLSYVGVNRGVNVGLLEPCQTYENSFATGSLYISKGLYIDGHIYGRTYDYYAQIIIWVENNETIIEALIWCVLL